MYVLKKNPCVSGAMQTNVLQGSIVNPKSFHHKEKKSFSFFCSFYHYLYEMTDAN